MHNLVMLRRKVVLTHDASRLILVSLLHLWFEGSKARTQGFGHVKQVLYSAQTDYGQIICYLKRVHLTHGGGLAISALTGAEG